MIEINKEQKFLIEECNSSSDIFKILENEIKEAIIEKRIKMPFIVKDLQKKLNRKISLDSLKKFVANNKKKWLKEKKLKKMKQKGKKMQNDNIEIVIPKKVIAIVNFKGGVGKSTIANLLNFKDKIIINLDEAQNAEKMNLKNTTTNFFQLKEEYGIENIKEAVDGAFEAGKNPVILDTPGDIKEFMEALSLVDFFIVPFTPGERSQDATFTTIEIINSILDDLSDKRKDKWCIVLNKYVVENNLKELDETYEKAKKILGDRLVCKTSLKYSGVVPTMERKKIGIDELITISPIAYGTFKKRIKKFNNAIENTLLV